MRGVNVFRILIKGESRIIDVDSIMLYLKKQEEQLTNFGAPISNQISWKTSDTSRSIHSNALTIQFKL